MKTTWPNSDFLAKCGLAKCGHNPHCAHDQPFLQTLRTMNWWYPNQQTVTSGLQLVLTVIPCHAGQRTFFHVDRYPNARLTTRRVFTPRTSLCGQCAHQSVGTAGIHRGMLHASKKMNDDNQTLPVEFGMESVSSSWPLVTHIREFIPRRTEMHDSVCTLRNMTFVDKGCGGLLGHRTRGAQFQCHARATKECPTSVRNRILGGRLSLSPFDPSTFFFPRQVCLPTLPCTFSSPLPNVSSVVTCLLLPPWHSVRDFSG